MAKNTGQGYRKGAVRDRSQVHNPKTDTWVKRDGDSGRFMDNKTSGGPHKALTPFLFAHMLDKQSLATILTSLAPDASAPAPTVALGSGVNCVE